MAHSISHEIQGKIVVFNLSGYMETEACGKIQTLFSELSKTYKKYVFNFSDVSIVNSGGIANFLEIFSKKLSDPSLDFALCNLNHSTEYSFKVVGVFNLVKAYPDMASAIAVLNGA
jgi:anti-anti-sigma factor